jgi:hypothetical protein
MPDTTTRPLQASSRRDRLADAVVGGRGARAGADRVGLDFEGFARQIACAARLFVKSFQHCFFMGYTHAGSINELRKQKTCQT